MVCTFFLPTKKFRDIFHHPPSSGSGISIDRTWQRKTKVSPSANSFVSSKPLEAVKEINAKLKRMETSESPIVTTLRAFRRRVKVPYGVWLRRRAAVFYRTLGNSRELAEGRAMEDLWRRKRNAERFDSRDSPKFLETRQTLNNRATYTYIPLSLLGEEVERIFRTVSLLPCFSQTVFISASISC